MHTVGFGNNQIITYANPSPNSRFAVQSSTFNLQRSVMILLSQ